jgi:hypothetical protein
MKKTRRAVRAVRDDRGDGRRKRRGERIGQRKGDGRDELQYLVCVGMEVG